MRALAKQSKVEIMKRKSFYILLSFIILAFVFLLWWPWPKTIKVKQMSFAQLPGWNNTSVKKSLLAFQQSCTFFLKKNPDHFVGSEMIPLQAKDWQPACRAAQLINPVSETSAKKFFEHWFSPVQFYTHKPLSGFFTGYYLPLLHGSLTQTKDYSVPIYGVPSDLITLDWHQFDSTMKKQKIVGRLENNRFVPYYTREEISQNAIKGKAPVLAWVDSAVERIFLETEGSGNILLTNGQFLYIGYAGKNGAPYASIASILIKKGALTPDSASTQNILNYFKTHPNEINTILNQNQSFIFFRIRQEKAAVSSEGFTLTPGYSLAVDKTWIPMGTPLWLNTKRPQPKQNHPISWQRLVIAQDTGSAIHGPVRGDIFWGSGKYATFMAANMKSRGYYWLLLPRAIVPNVPKVIKYNQP